MLLLGQLVTGMNEVRDTLTGLVTRADLKDLAEQQRQEMHTYVDAVEDKMIREVEGVKEKAVTKEEHAELIEKYARLASRVDELEQGSGNKRRPNPSDAANFQIAFKGFDKEGSDARIEELTSFMQQNFPSETSFVVDHKMKGAGKKELSDISFVQFPTRGIRDRVMAKIRERYSAEKGPVKVDRESAPALAVDRARTEWQRERNWAMRKSEELIREKLRKNNITASVEYKASKDERKIVVNGAAAFVQKSDAPRGAFAGDFVDLALPK